MKFSEKSWKCEGLADQAVIEVIFDFKDIENAAKVADAKVQFINAHNPGGIRRSPDIIRNRIIAGKLADAAVTRLLQDRVTKLGLTGQITITEYDQTRSDGFEHPDPYDLELQRTLSNKLETIEVRSSFCYRLAPPEKIVQKLSIYGWYTSANKPIETPRDWYWQVIYYLRPDDIEQGTGPRVPVFEEELEKGKLIAFIVGGANKQLLEIHGTNRSDQDGATYRAISPICAGLDFWQMVEAMFGQIQ